MTPIAKIVVKNPKGTMNPIAESIASLRLHCTSFSKMFSLGAFVVLWCMIVPPSYLSFISITNRLRIIHVKD